MKCVQCSLRTDPNASGYVTMLTAWLEARPDLKEGVKVTLKDSADPELLWNVTHVGEIVLDKKDIKHPGAFFDSDI